MKVAIVNQALKGGGAAIACVRVFEAVRALGVSSQLFSTDSSSDASVSVKSKVVARIERLILGLLKTHNSTHHSLGYFSGGLVKSLIGSDCDLVHLHWVNNGCLSVSDVNQIARTKPIVWTLHDMWLFCGAEHYVGSYSDRRYELGYKNDNRPEGERGLDLNRLVWERKSRLLPNNIVYITPSRWLADVARRSVLLRNSRIEVIPNAIDTDFWAPAEGGRSRLDIGDDECVILFSSAAGYVEWRKGQDLLEGALDIVKAKTSKKIVAVTMGGAKLEINDDSGLFRTISTGFLNSAEEIRKWYQVSDIVVVPSRIDNFPNVALEAMSCGAVCCAFDSGGISESVVNGVTGIIAEREDVSGLADGILSLVEDEGLRKKLRQRARSEVVRRYSYPVIGKMHLDLYLDVLERSHS